jgi:hypothetical protein
MQFPLLQWPLLTLDFTLGIDNIIDRVFQGINNASIGSMILIILYYGGRLVSDIINQRLVRVN